MRPRTIPVLAVVALGLATPPSAEARPRFGLLGAMAAPFGMFGARHSFRHHRHSARPSLARRGETRPERGAMGSALAPAAAAKAAVFWPDASADLADYLFFPLAKDDRFWSYGYGAIVATALAAPDTDDTRDVRQTRFADGDSAAAARGESGPAAAPCDSNASDAAAVIEQIAQAIAPNAQQRAALERLRSALEQATERIKATCPAGKPATIAQRLQVIQDRVWAMHDALLTIRLPLESFYASLNDDQRSRLQRDETDARGSAATPAEGRAQPCGGPAAAQDPLQSLEHAMGDERQRAGLEALRQTSAAMAQLIATSCPASPLPDLMRRFDAAADRLDVLLFAVMAVSPALEAFYDSLDENQKRGVALAIRQRRSPSAGDEL